MRRVCVPGSARQRAEPQRRQTERVGGGQPSQAAGSFLNLLYHFNLLYQELQTRTRSLLLLQERELRLRNRKKPAQATLLFPGG